MEVVKSISYDQGEIIRGILKLHTENHKIDCDCTYSKGNFYKNTGIEEPKYKYDINPQAEGVVQADSRDLPLVGSCIKTMMFDPPFLATKGASLKEKDDGNNIIANRFSVFPTEKELHQYYIDTMKEIYRVLYPDGILIFKCQDKISSGKQYMTHIFIHDAAVSLGFYPKDLFILLAKSRLVADWQAQNQKNARKYHSYFWVFQKTNKKIEYI